MVGGLTEVGSDGLGRLGRAGLSWVELDGLDWLAGLLDKEKKAQVCSVRICFRFDDVQTGLSLNLCKRICKKNELALLLETQPTMEKV